MTERIIHFESLPHYFTIKAEFDQEKDLVTVYVESKIHVNKRVKVPTQWSIDFVNTRSREFEGDILGFVVRNYGLKLRPAKYE